MKFQLVAGVADTVMGLVSLCKVRLFFNFFSCFKSTIIFEFLGEMWEEEKVFLRISRNILAEEWATRIYL